MAYKRTKMLLAGCAIASIAVGSTGCSGYAIDPSAPAPKPMKADVPQGEAESKQAVGSGAAPPTSASPTPNLPVDKSPEKQLIRKSFVKNQAADGLFDKLEADSSATRLWVTPKFLLLSPVVKNGYVKCVYEYVFDGSKASDFVSLYDSETGREIGQYSRDAGLVMKRDVP